MLLSNKYKAFYKKNVLIDWLIWSYACQLIAIRIYLISQARETSPDKNLSRTSLCFFYLLFFVKLAIFENKLITFSSFLH
jgi:hypothetical protein